MPDAQTIKCPICQKENPSDVNFCKTCHYPLNVKKIDQLNRKELSVCLDSFLEVLNKTKKPLFENEELEQVYDQFFSLYWLRPGSALLRFIESKILFSFKDRYLKYPTLDLGCGDGLFTSILFGARLNKKYDGFEAVDFSKKEIYDTFQKLPDNLFVKKPRPVGFGVDIKENAVKKAKDLAVYDEVKIGDVREVPFESESVNSVFSNMIDDIERKDLPLVFKEVHRVLKKDEHFIFTTPTENFREFLFFYNKAQDFKKQGDEENYRLFLGLDRGRSEWEPTSRSFWTELAQKTSFELVEYIEYGNKNLLQLWDTGLRPFFYYLMKQRNFLRKKGLNLSVKRIYLEIMKPWLLKFTKNQIAPEGGGSFAVIVFKKAPYEKRK